MTRLDYARYDHLIGMDESNLCDILRLVGGDPQHKVSLLMAHTDHPREVADQWFTGDFEATWQDILEGCTALLEEPVSYTHLPSPRRSRPDQKR